MALAIAYNEAKTNQRTVEPNLSRGRKGGGTHTNFFGSHGNPNLPLASLNQHDRGYFHGPHFHTVDQFQVVVEGEGRLGRHDLSPYSVHFTHAYTPYGPLVSDASNGLTFFVMRAHPDTGSQRLPRELDQLKRATNRNPRQITRPVTFPALQSGGATTDIVVQAVPDLEDEHGLAAYTLRMKPNTKAYAPDPSHGDGQYLVIVKGSVLYENKEHNALALVFVWPKEGPFQVHAGPTGLEALILNFPRPSSRAIGTPKAAQPTTGLKTWQCALCGLVYDEAKGMPTEGIAPGTRWEDVPGNWSCPDCSAVKGDFQMVEL